MSTPRWFLGVLFGTLAVKLILAATLPLLGDEGYVFLWGRYLDWGYYDHPPMAGWLARLSLLLGDSRLALRLPAVLLSTVVGLGLVRVLRPLDADRAYLVGALYLLAPINVVGVLAVTDVPLIGFSFLATVFFYRALRDGRLNDYAASGAAFGLAFLSKHLAVLLALAFLASVRGRWNDGRHWRGLGVLFAAALPFGLLNLWWNFEHCWSNVIFNLYSRHVGEIPRSSIQSLVILAVTAFYLATPQILIGLARQRKAVARALSDQTLRGFWLALTVPLGVLLALAVLGATGAYWVLPFYPCLFVLAHRSLERRTLVRAVRFTAAFLVLHLTFLATLGARSLETYVGLRRYRSLVMMVDSRGLLEAAEPLLGGAHLAARGYSPAALLSWGRGRNVTIFGPGSHYGRFDDSLTDFSSLDGEDIAVLVKKVDFLEGYRPYFRQVEILPLEYRQASFSIVLGRDFDYPRYRREVLESVREQYYDVGFPLPWAGCPFCERYFSADCKEGCGED